MARFSFQASKNLTVTSDVGAVPQSASQPGKRRPSSAPVQLGNSSGATQRPSPHWTESSKMRGMTTSRTWSTAASQCSTTAFASMDAS